MAFNWVTLKEEMRKDAEFRIEKTKEKQILWQNEKRIITLLPLLKN